MFGGIAVNSIWVRAYEMFIRIICIRCVSQPCYLLERASASHKYFTDTVASLASGSVFGFHQPAFTVHMYLAESTSLKIGRAATVTSYNVYNLNHILLFNDIWYVQPIIPYDIASLFK